MSSGEILLNGSIAMMLQEGGGGSREYFRNLFSGVGDVLQLAMAILAGFAAWYLGQRLLEAWFIRKATSFCPTCFSPRMQPQPRRPLEMVVPFLTPLGCSDCGKRFFRGRKPPFARCPECRSSKLETAARVRGGWGDVIRAYFGAKGYRCLRCEVNFVDFRPLRPTGEPQGVASPVAEARAQDRSHAR
jgi:hypothetical protein